MDYKYMSINLLTVYLDFKKIFVALVALVMAISISWMRIFSTARLSHVPISFEKGL